MRKKTKALSGASQDAYFRRVLKANPNLSAEERDQIVRKLRQEVAQLRVRLEPRQGEDRLPVVAAPAEPVAAAVAQPFPAIAAEARARPLPVPTAEPFDPFCPNIVVVVRKSGRAAALAALDAIDSLDHLRLLAREQRLSISAELSSVAEVRTAIVTAAERRIANRMAAAS